MPETEREDTWQCGTCKKLVPWDVRHLGVEKGEAIRCVAVRIWLFKVGEDEYVSKSKVLKE